MDHSRTHDKSYDIQDNYYHDPRDGSEQNVIQPYSPNMYSATLPPFAYPPNPQYQHAHVHTSNQSYRPIHQSVPYNHQNIMNRPSHQHGQGLNRALSELDPNDLSLSRSTSSGPPTYMDLSHSYPQKSQSGPKAVDKNSNRTYSQHPPPQSTSSANVQMRITDVESSPQNAETAAQMDVENPSGMKDLSNNYVYRILMRSFRGKVELEKQKHFEEEMKKRESIADESRVAEAQDDTLSDGTDDSDVESQDDDEEDDHDSDFDEYKVVIIDKLDRDRICDLVMDYEVDHHGFMPTRERYDFLGDSLVEVFIYEDKAAWIGVSEEGVVKGRFPNKVKKLRVIGTESGLWKSPFTRKKKTKGAPKPSLACLIYFKDNTVIDGGFRLKWDEYNAERIVFFKSSSIPTITTDISALLTPKGFELLVLDFKSSHASYETLEDKWPKIAEKVLDVAKEAVRGTRYKKELKNILEVHKTAKSQEYKENLALLVTAYLLGSVQCTLIKKPTTGEKTWRTTLKQAQESFLIHIETTTPGEPEVGKKMTEMKKLFDKHNLPLAPYVIACGKLEEITHCYVTLGQYKYRFEGAKCLLKALDVCYQCTSALYKKPPKPAEYIWEFLRKYALGEKIDAPACAVTSLLTSLRTHKIKPAKPPAPKKRKRKANPTAQKRNK